MSDLSADRLYAETCNSIRATDDISFKLMGFVPLVSGAALLSLFLKESIAPSKAPLVVALALFAALITLGLFRWELRNIQTCGWLRQRAEVLEQALVTTSHAPIQPKPPNKIGKTEAEKSIYSFTILSWLIMPMIVTNTVQNVLFRIYIIVAVVIAVLTVLTVIKSVRMPQLVASANIPPKPAQ